jgi:Raf kinase inhibitor-like YbhB/YbcL family protein
MWVRFGVAIALLALGSLPAAASTFTIDTSAFLNGGDIPKTDAAGGDCGGRNLSPPFRLSGAPAGARSFAVVAVDTDARNGAGFVHWVAYGISPSAMSLPPGFGTAASPAYTGGLNDAGTTLYHGPCPPRGDPPHHYVFTAYALDLAPAALPGGLDRGSFLRAIAAHRLAQAHVTGVFSR